jgi:RND family efflux transporter MFP subunit
MHFTPGTQVAEGDLLFVIDRDTYEADFQAAEADLAQAEAAAELARVTLQRMRDAGAAVSRVQVDEAAAEARRADAEVLVQQARVRQAKINLDYTEVTAPIAGRVGRNLVDVGNLVGEGEATLLTDITAYDPIYVYFSINERDLLRVMELWRQSLADEGVDPTTEAASQAHVPLAMGVATENGYPHEGTLDFGESGVDPNTGTLQVRGVFANPGFPPALLPGLFARVRMPIETRPDMPLVTERAIGADQSGQYVLVVDAEGGEVAKQNVVLGQLVDGLRVIEEGVGADAWIVVNGLQRARPGATVEPEMADMAAFTASALAAESAAREGSDGAREPSEEGEAEPDDAEAAPEDDASAPADAEAKAE